MEILTILILILPTAFWIFAFVHCVRRENFQAMSKERWMIIIFLFFVAGALAYFLLERGSNHEAAQNINRRTMEGQPYTVEEARKELRRPDVLIGLIFSIGYLVVITVRSLQTGDTYTLRIGLTYALVMFLVGQILLWWFRRQKKWTIRIGATTLTFKQLNALVVLLSLFIYIFIVTFFLIES